VRYVGLKRERMKKDGVPLANCPGENNTDASPGAKPLYQVMTKGAGDDWRLGEPAKLKRADLPTIPERNQHHGSPLND